MLRRQLNLTGLRRGRAPPSARTVAAGVRCQSSQASQHSRLDRITAKLPKRLQKYTTRLRNAPVSHVVSFLILHELTAIVPLFALFALFHYTTYVPISYMTDHFGGYVQSSIEKFERYFRRKRWFGFDQEESRSNQPVDGGQRSHTDMVMDRWKRGEANLASHPDHWKRFGNAMVCRRAD
ncbi:hypothetical protein DCS_02815 [Drechmeria coniospora]|uniref:Uncharacterized protein n=1 Tax=Drechmeria coniospora TaxID=98403 RepID=A0A151GXB0_DRECN|nr:hypothetical protein DCS_02815 [Drechmeria coniospora]KYK61672.1 hypothetical protein DCS_02815 [Drechmeria coniospora]